MKLVKRSRSIVAGLILSAACMLHACSQGSGESCQVDGDCSSGLTCFRGAAGDRGYCCDRAAADCTGGAEVDAGGGGSVDSGSGDDSGAVPMSMDDAGDDAGNSDAG